MNPIREAARILSDRPVLLELFSGVGGLGLGLEQAGFHTSLAIEIEEITGRYASYNFPATRVLFGDPGDVRKLDKAALRIMDGAFGREVTLIAGGPPCQGYSLAGKKLTEDPLNSLVLEFARIVLELNPHSFLIENVPGITTSNSPHLAHAIKQLQKRYEVTEPTSLLASDFGVPQQRERIFVLGIRRDLGKLPSFPEPSHLVPSGTQQRLNVLPSTPVVWEAISDIPEVDEYIELIDGDRVPYTKEPETEYQRVMRDTIHDPDDLSLRVVWDRKICTNLRRTRHGADLLNRFAKLRYGQIEKISGIRRLSPDEVSTTIRAGTTKDRGSWSAPRPLHPFQNRVLTTRECARIQSFPDWFYFHPAKWHGNRQVGNAVPPVLARAIGKHLMSLLKISRPTTALPQVSRDESLVRADLEDALLSGLSTRNVSQKVTHPRRLLIDEGRAISSSEY